MAAQVLRATTATPPSGWKAGAPWNAGISTTFSTPGTCSALLAATELRTLPPTTGGRATTAIDHAGQRMSMPNCACPLPIASMSTVRTDAALADVAEFRGASSAQAASFRARAARGVGGQFAEAEAPTRSPLVQHLVLHRLDLGDRHRPPLPRQHVSSICRAAAPTRRIGAKKWRTLREPSTFWLP
jgi:hypothetical protein